MDRIVRAVAQCIGSGGTLKSLLQLCAVRNNSFSSASLSNNVAIIIFTSSDPDIEETLIVAELTVPELPVLPILDSVTSLPVSMSHGPVPYAQPSSPKPPLGSAEKSLLKPRSDHSNQVLQVRLININPDPESGAPISATWDNGSPSAEGLARVISNFDRAN